MARFDEKTGERLPDNKQPEPVKVPEQPKLEPEKAPDPEPPKGDDKKPPKGGK